MTKFFCDESGFSYYQADSRIRGTLATAIWKWFFLTSRKCATAKSRTELVSGSGHLPESDWIRDQPELVVWTPPFQLIGKTVCQLKVPAICRIKFDKRGISERVVDHWRLKWMANVLHQIFQRIKEKARDICTCICLQISHHLQDMWRVKAIEAEKFPWIPQKKFPKQI